MAITNGVGSNLEDPAAVQKKVVELAFSGVRLPGPSEKPDFREQSFLSMLRGTGTKLWLDTGHIEMAERLWNRHLSALTTNNTLLSKEVTKGIYDDLIKRAVKEIRAIVPGISSDDLVLEIGFLLNAHHGLRLVEKFHARVSVELHTDLAHNFEMTMATARRLHAVCPEFFIVKIPLTPAGLLASRKLVQDGVPVNFTVEFSARQNYVAARVAAPAFVNVFLNRLNEFVNQNDFGDSRFIGEKATLVSQRELLKLREKGACQTRQIAASIRSTDHVLNLLGVDVHTIPVTVLEELAALKTEPGQIRQRRDADFPITLHPGIDERSIGLDTLWGVPGNLRTAVDQLCAENLDAFSSSDIIEFFAAQGIPDLFVEWTDEEWSNLRIDGKIPSYGRWKDHLKDRVVGLDALFNAAGLMAFASDQEKMDEQVRAFI